MGCAFQRVAPVRDADKPPLGLLDTSYEINQSDVRKDDRLIVLRISHKNPLRFSNSAEVRQYPSSKTGYSIVSLFLNNADDDKIFLIRFKSDGGDTAYVHPTPCLKERNIRCNINCYADHSYLKIKLPAPGKSTYAGHLSFVLEDQFPHRGTQNYPVIKRLNIVDEYDKDIKIALKKWPILIKSEVAKNIAVIETGRLDFY